MPMRQVLLARLIAMGVVALISAIWPGFARVVFGDFVMVLALAVLAPTLLWCAVAARRDRRAA